MPIVNQDISNKHVTSPDCIFLLCIQHFNSGFRTCDIVFQEGKSFLEGLSFCNFVRNTIYVTSTNWLRVVVVARYLKFEYITFYTLSGYHYNLQALFGTRSLATSSDF